MRSGLTKTIGVLCLLLGGALIFAHVGSPAPFTIDDNAHVVSVAALRQGSFAVPGTEKLSPNRELFWFDPMGASRPPHARAVSTLPPIYAVIAQPFVTLGWRGLLFLQAAMFFFTLWLVFWIVRRRLTDRRLAWLAVITLGLGGALVEYALGLWPHMLSMALATLAFVLLSEGLGHPKAQWRLRVAAGFAIGLAIGVRYQNVAYALGLAFGLLLLSRSRLRDMSAFGLGLSPPLLFNALVNYSRLGSFNPITKGGSYLAMGNIGKSRLASVAYAVISRVFDSSLTPTSSLKNQSWWHRDRRSGALTYGGIIKKAWLQSLPWAALPLIVMIRAWFLPRVSPGKEKANSVEAGTVKSSQNPTMTTREARRGSVDLRLISLITLSVLGTILSFGVQRHDGLCFGQRYFIDLTPLLVHGLMISLDRLGDPKWVKRLVMSFFLGAIVVVFISGGLSDRSPIRYLLLLNIPLILSILLVSAWLFRHRWRGAVAIVLGLSIAWAGGVHLFNDVHTSLAVRRRHYNEAALLAKALPRHDPIALFINWKNKDAVGPLVLSRDLVIADAHNDGGAAAPKLLREFLDQGRRVFIVLNGHSKALIKKMGKGLRVASERSLPIPGLRWPWILIELAR